MILYVIAIPLVFAVLLYVVNWISKKIWPNLQPLRWEETSEEELPPW